MTKKVLFIIIVGILIRLALMITTIHPDIRGHNLGAYLISQKGEILTFYDHIRSLPRSHLLVNLYGDGLFIYPPLAYLWLAGFMKILGGLYPWETFNVLISDIGRVGLSLETMKLLFLLKVPYLITELLAFTWFYRKIDESKKTIFSLLWWGNIPVMHSAYFMGQFDLMIGLLVGGAAIIATGLGKFVPAILVGIAAGFKPFPLFLLPMLGTGFKEKLISIIVGLVTYGLIISPYLGSVGFRHYALLASQTDKLDYAKIFVAGSQYLSLFWVGLGLLYWWNWYKPHHLSVWGWFTSVLLLFYSVTHWHPQWFTWISILLIISLITKSKTRLPIFILFCVSTLIILSFYIFIPDNVVSMARAMLAATSIITVLKMREA